MNYPGHSVKQQAFDITAVKAIQHQLNKKGCGPVYIDGDFDHNTHYAVMLFQTRFTDCFGNPLKIDGIVGPVTWSALFGARKINAITRTPNALLAAVLDVARSQVGINEFPSGGNDGPRVTKYHDTAGIQHGQCWAMAFVYWCFNQACIHLEVANPLYKTGDVFETMVKSKCKILTPEDAKIDAGRVLPGHIFIISTGGGHSHTGLIEKVENEMLTTIEGNISHQNTRDAIGVFRRTGRMIETINTGFIEFE